MLLTISSSDSPARDLGYLLGKHPDRAQSLSLAHGTAHVCFPEATDERCTCALVLDVDPIGLVRRSADDGFALSQYTNDRPYVASSFLSVAIGRVFGQALAGRCAQRPDLASRALPLEARLPCVAVHGGERFVRALFEPLGYEVESERGVVLDEAFPEWGHAPYHALRLEGRVRLSELLRHLTVLLPVLDDDKHYFVGKDEVEKLLARGEGWLASHPERDSIVRRYLKHRGSLTREALLRLSEEETDDPDRRDEEARQDEETLERTITLAERRLDAVMAALEETGARTVADLGCGEGKLLRRLLAAKQIERIVGMDVSVQALERASARLHLDELGPGSALASSCSKAPSPIATHDSKVSTQHASSRWSSTSNHRGSRRSSAWCSSTRHRAASS